MGDEASKGTESITFSQDEINNMQKDIDSAKSNLISDETKKEISRAKEEARVEAQKEMLINQEIKEKESTINDLKAKQIEQEKSFADKFKGMEDKLNEMTASRAPATNTNPFTSNTNALPKDSEDAVTRMSDQDINEIEKESGQAFLGEEFNRPI